MREDEIVTKLVGDPARPSRPVVVLTGYLGRSARRGRARLYLGPDLTRFVEFSERALVHDERAPLGGTMVWLDPDDTTRVRIAGSRDAMDMLLATPGLRIDAATVEPEDAARWRMIAEANAAGWAAALVIGADVEPLDETTA